MKSLVEAIRSTISGADEPAEKLVKLKDLVAGAKTAPSEHADSTLVITETSIPGSES